MEINHGYKTEIPQKLIFEQMKNCSYDFFQKTQNININLKLKGYFQQRNYIINLIKRISDQLGFKSQTFFLSIYYLDIIRLESTSNSLFNNFPSLALACLVIASKYCENDPNVPQLPYFIRVYNSIVDIRNRNTIAISDLIYNEVKICKILNYQLNYYTIYDYNSYLFGHGILKLDQLKEIKMDDDIPFSLYAKKILEKIYKKSRYYLDVIINKKICMKYNSLLLSIFIMQKSVESVIINESKINNDMEKLQIKRKAHKYFKEIMNNFYQINYDSIEEYQLMKNELEQNKYRNKNLVHNNTTSLETSKVINNYNKNNIMKKILTSYNNKNGNDFFFENPLTNSLNSQKYIKENKKITEESPLKYENINNEKINENTEINNFNYFINPINKKINNNFEIYSDIQNKNNKNKRVFSSNKYSNIESLNNNPKYFSKIEKNISFYNNNYTQNLTSSININNYNHNILTNIEKTKSTSTDSKNKNDVLYLTKNNKNNKIEYSKLINISEENKIKNKDFMNFYNNVSNSLNLNIKNKNNDEKTININKLYFKKILHNNDENKKMSNSTNKINKSKNKLKNYNVGGNNNKNNNPTIKLKNKLEVINIKTKSDENNFNINKRYGNIFLSSNQSENDDEEENDKNTNKYFSNKNEINQKDILNKKERNCSEYKIKKYNILSNNDYPVLKTEYENNLENNNLETYIGKLKKILENKRHNLNLNNDNSNILNNIGKQYIRTDINESFHSTIKKIKNKIRNKSKEIEINRKKSIKKPKKQLVKKKYSDKKINNLKSENLNKKVDKLNRHQEYNIITFLDNDINNKINFYTNNIKKNYLNNINNTEDLKNKSKIIINNNINNNCNKFDNETISFNSTKNINKILNFNSNDKSDNIQQKNTYKECKEFYIDEKNNKNENKIKNYCLTSSNTKNNIKNNNIIINNKINNNKNIISTIVINNNININLNKKSNSKEKSKYNFKMKFQNNTLKNFYRNTDNKLSKKNEMNNKTSEKLSNKNLKRIKINII